MTEDEFNNMMTFINRYNQHLDRLIEQEHRRYKRLNLKTRLQVKRVYLLYIVDKETKESLFC